LLRLYGAHFLELFYAIKNRAKNIDYSINKRIALMHIYVFFENPSLGARQ
jgi:hypothetical protein